MRLSILMALFNVAQIYLPFIHNRFHTYYGYGNLDTVFYFAIPSYIIIKFKNASILKRFIYCSFFMSVYSVFKIFYNKENKEKFNEFYLKYKNIEI